MPLGILLILIDVALAIHVVRSGRQISWVWIILVVPVFGALVYVLAEIVPEVFGSVPVRRASATVGQKLNAERDFHRLQEAVKDTPTADNKRRLADALADRGETAPAIALYESTLRPPHETDPTLLMGLARCRFLDGDPAGALADLDRLIECNPGYQSHDGHLLYARALEATGRFEDALAEYANLITVFPGEEARVRAGLLLKRLGRNREADALFDATVRAMKKGNRDYRRRNRQWLDMVPTAGRE